ncbi:MAG: tRNA adenosine(34) deaminase TadA [Actinomycetota bacterium]
MTDDDLMAAAIAEARAALDHGDVPIGALVVVNGEVIASRHNERELQGDPTAHAEILALRDAAAHVGSSRLDGATLVSTLEPCPMCAGAAWLARVDRVVFGADDMKAGALGSLYNIGADPRLNHEFEVTPRVRMDECAELLTAFFRDKRGDHQPGEASFRSG